MDLIDFLSTENWEGIFDFDNFRCITGLFRCLHIQFLGLIGSIDRFSILKVFGDLVNFLLRFGWNRRRDFLMLARIGLSTVLLLQLDGGGIFGVNLAEIFCLRVFAFLSAMSESHLD